MSEIIFSLLVFTILILIYSYQIAFLFYKLQYFIPAIIFFKISTLLDSSAELLVLIGNCHADLGYDDMAVNYYEKSILKEEKNYSAYKNLGLVYVDKKDWSKAIAYFDKAYRIRHGIAYNQGNSELEYYNYEEEILIGRHKLKHDIEQFNYLIEKKLLPGSFFRQVKNYQEVLDDIKNSTMFLIPANKKQKELIINTYDQNIYFEKNEPIKNPINTKNNFLNIKKEYQEKEYAFFDNFLTVETLEKVKNFCLNSTIWHEYQRNRGYLESNMDNGFYLPLFFEIAEEIRKLLPDIFKSYSLVNMWAFKYDSQMEGVLIHADEAMINLNFWITNEQANLDRQSGGMVIYNIKAPKKWNFEKYNTNTELIKNFLEKSNAIKQVIPYRENRAVIFNSNLFHETDKFVFKDGYENRRINITMIFGKRE